MLIHRDALSVVEAITKEDTRYFLNGALFDKQGRAIATNGHTLIRFTGGHCDPSLFPKIDGVMKIEHGENVLIAADDMRAIRATLPKQSTMAPLNYIAVVPNGKRLVLATSDGDRIVTLNAKKIEGDFPSYQSMLDKAEKAPVKARVILSPEELGVLVRAAKAAGVKSIEFTFHGTDDDVLEPVTIKAKSDSGTFDGAIMPMRS